MNSVKRQLLKPKRRCGEYPRQVDVTLPQRTDFKSTKIKRKIDDDDSDNQPPNKKVQLSNQENKSKLIRSKSARNESDSTNSSKNQELTTTKYRIPKRTTSVNKYSANDRLRKYRQCLGACKEDVIKVHSILKSASPKCETIDSTVPKNYDSINDSLKKVTCDHYTSSTSRINKSLKTVESVTCDDYTSLTSSRINNRLKTVESVTYDDYTSLTSSRINNRLKTVESVTCDDYTSLTSSKINNSLKRVESVTCNDDYMSSTSSGTNKRSKTVESVTCNDHKSSSSSPSVQKRLLKVKSFSDPRLCEPLSFKATSSKECNGSENNQFTNKTSGNDRSNLNVSSVSQPLNEDSDVDMEWSPIEVNEVVSDIQKLRQEMQTNKEQDIKNKNESKKENIYVVVDTNVFISHLTTLKDLINLNPCASKSPVIIVPWMVVQELDFFKDGRSESDSMRNSARRAIKFINDNLTSKNQRLRGQTVQDALKQEAQSSNPDDGILFCCLQISQEDKPTVLLSNDINLRNKALIHGISSHGTADIIAEINGALLGRASEGNKGEQIIVQFTRLCSLIIENEMKLAYGTVARNLISDPPWSLKQCLIYIKRFWGPVFSLIIPQKQFVKILDDMIYFHTSRKEISSDEDVEQFTKLCFSMCVYFKNCLIKYKEQVQECITNIEEIVS